MKDDNLSLLVPGIFVSLLVVCVVTLYFLNPFGNECVQGDCNSGKGIFIYSSGIKYDGEWKNGRKHGKGTVEYADGTRYEGSWFNNHKHGHGIMKYPDGKMFDGNWERGRRHGQGILTYGNGTIFNGMWENDERHGSGTLVLFDGSEFKGEWERDKLMKCLKGNCRNGYGYGILMSEDFLFKGTWNKGNLHGHATVIYPDGRTYEGEWVKGMMSGKGTLTYPDGAVLKTEWKNDHASSPGMFISAKGDKQIIDQFNVDSYFYDIKTLWKS